MAERVGRRRLGFGGLTRSHCAVARVESVVFVARRERRRMAERVGFEPTCRLPDNTLSRRARYDHFGTSPHAQNAQVVQKRDSSSFHPDRASTKTQES